MKALSMLLVGLCVCTTAAKGAAEDSAVDLPEVGDVVFRLAGDDLSAMTTWLEKTKHNDPDGVFSMQEGVLRASDGGMGYIATRDAFENYYLSFETRWGKLQRPSKYVRNSGLLLHGHGPDGSAGGRWISSVECQLAQGCEGDFILIRGKNDEGERTDSTLWSRITFGPDKRPRWDPDHGKATQYSGRQFWWRNHEVGFKELIDTRGKQDAASPLGEWTKVEAFCHGDQITIRINGQVVNHAYDVKPAKGRIAFQCEGYEIFFRNIEVRKLKD